MREDRNEPVTIDEVIVKHVTEKALLCEIEDAQVWIPKSQLQDGTDVEDIDDIGVIVIPRWLAESKKLV